MYKNDNITVIDKFIENKKISHAFLLEVDEEYTTSFAKNIVKQMLKNVVLQEDFLKICSLIDCDNFPELKIIRPDGKFIKKEQLAQLMYDLKNKPIHSDNIFYIIEFAENLNNSSANSILKFLEEPEDGIIAILITKNAYNVLPTISSRCQLISFNKYEKKKFDDALLPIAINFVITLKKKNKHSIAYLSELYALKSDDLIEILNICIIIYSEVLQYLKTKQKTEFIENNNEINSILDDFGAFEIIEIINKLTEVLTLLKYNVNPRVVLDKVILSKYKEVVL